ncbi:MAG: hypothetical protein IJI68_11185 [Eggerthellaceae bacterium]|nr:hypothetical protein [Eggerthellaceae bacterium]
MKRIVALIAAIALAFVFTGTAFADTLAGGSVAQGINGAKACEIALKNAGLTKKKVSNLQVKSKKQYFEVGFTKKCGGTKYEYDVAKNGGKILEKEVKYAYKRCCSKAKVGKTAVLKQVAKHSKKKLCVVKKGSCTYKYSNHEGRYKVKFSYKGYRYEYELLAPTGKIAEWEKERIKR